MNLDKAKILLGQKEGAKLDFKRKIYKIYNKDRDFRRKQTDELIKDIISISNGDAYTVDEVGYLIFGAGDKFDENGKRKLYDVGNRLPTERDILDWVNSAIDIPLEDIECTQIEIDECNLFIISIPSSLHLRETTRQLETPSGNYSQHITLIRNNESNYPASKKERQVIREAKQRYFASMKQVSAPTVGLILGTLLSGAFYGPNVEKLGLVGIQAKIGTILGLLIGAGLGWLIGTVFKDFIDIKMKWYKFSKRTKFILVLIGAVLILGYFILIF